MSDLVGNPEDRFSRVEAHFMFKHLRENGILISAEKDDFSKMIFKCCNSTV